jgi:predicted ATPase/DNA-binding CsgD family transcriptional regulator
MRELADRLPGAPLFGRDTELEQLRVRLCDPWVRLITLTGCPGVGKSALAFHHLFRDALVVSARDMHLGADLADLAGAAAASSGTSSARGATTSHGSLSAWVAGNPTPVGLHGERPPLLILDGADALGAAALVRHLLAVQPGTKLLVTRRAPLRLRAEVVLPLVPLATSAVPVGPGDGLDGSELDNEALLRNPAVALFVARARETCPDFAMTEENAAAVAHICRRLDGLPLAIELAACWLSTLPIETLLARLTGALGQRGEQEQHGRQEQGRQAALDLLSDGYGDGADAPRDVRAALASCYAGLPPDVQRLLRWLAEFDGEFALPDIQALGAPAPLLPLPDTADTAGRPPVSPRALHVLHALRVLVEHGLVARTCDAHPPRFRLLHLVRDFALERLTAAGEWSIVHRRLGAQCDALLLPPAPLRPLLPPPPASEPTVGGRRMELGPPVTGMLSRLSPRERHVLRLVADGLSNRAIARELSLSERTIAHHLTAIYNKLGVESRTAAATLALRSGLA